VIAWSIDSEAILKAKKTITTTTTKKKPHKNVKFIEGEGEAPTRDSRGDLWLGGIEALVFVSEGLYKLKGLMVGEIWAVLAG
jgi:hypothetical protein